MSKADFFKYFRLDDFYKNNREISKTNGKNVYNLSALIALILTAYLMFVLIFPQFLVKRFLLGIYIVFILLFAIIFLCANTLRNNKYSNIFFVQLLSVLFEISMYALTIIISVCQTEYPAIYFLVALIVMPMIFILQPLYSTLISCCATFVCLICSYFISNTYFELNLVNCIFILILNYFLGVTTSKNKRSELEAKNKYKMLSSIDELTGLYNRRHFNIDFEKMFHKALNEKKPIGIFLIDVDDFKSYNDYYGHLGGDECLRILGLAFKRYSETTAQQITFYRYGGEEFIGVIYNADRKYANKIADDLLELVRGLQIKHCASTVSNIVTISLGAMVQYPSVLDNSVEFVNLADKAMYKVKESGKNSYKFY